MDILIYVSVMSIIATVVTVAAIILDYRKETESEKKENEKLDKKLIQLGIEERQRRKYQQQKKNIFWKRG